MEFIPNADMLNGALSLLFQPKVLIWLVVGLISGFIVGAIPGFNDTNFLAMVLPFTVYLGPMQAVIFMMAVFCGSQTAGSIPAILVNIPGTPSNAPTTLEGFALTRQGRAGEALGCSLFSSTMGGLSGSIICLLLAPIIGIYALKFGPAEICAMAIFGMSAVGSLTGRSISKGLVSSLLGLLLATIGTEMELGRMRSTFGFYELAEGFPLIPVLLGAFGFSEVLSLVQEEYIISDRAVFRFRGYASLFQGMRESLRYKLSMLRSAIIGVLVGLVPGVGAAVATWISYGQARAWSKTPEKFGTGHYEGLVATDTCNNGVTGGALIPTMTLGIPGSGTTVVVMAALMINGIQPGPSLFMNFQQEAYAIFFSLFLSNVLMFLVGLVVMRFLPLVTYVPTRILAPIMALFCLVGGLAWRGFVFDMILVFFFGLLGLVMKRNGYSTPALVLAVILGPIAEKNLIWSLKIGGPAIFLRPISLGILLATVGAIFVPVFIRKIARSGVADRVTGSGE
ncbi:MAG: tripartite tricarboxylate transporter permease [Deltaproteobacteria bacterium]|nr:tripartite tricarboxylate transporter permease [Deltaproteobacteria bacterium]